MKRKEEFKEQKANSIDPGEAVHYELSGATGMLFANSTFSLKAFSVLTLKAPIRTAADNIRKYFFIVFQRK